MTEMELLIDFHKNAERQGPGSASDTLKALNFIDIEPKRPLKIADIGCGTGAQTITLAQNLEGQITAVDLFPVFLTQLKERARAHALQDKVITIESSMDDLPFRQEEFDIIWSEGAIYIIGFEAGISRWKSYLKSGGYIAISEITWITDSRPKEIEVFWKNEYPEIDMASNKIGILEKNGFSPVGYFILPQSSWIDRYYRPMTQQFTDFLERHNHSQAAKAIVEGEKEEIERYKKYKDYFSYGFYIAKKL